MDEDIQLMIDEALSPKAQALILADEAVSTRNEVARQNAYILGRELGYRVFVDGVLGVVEALVLPPPLGVIRYEFNVADKILQFISARLHDLSPIGGEGDRHPGLYQRSHTLYADGVEVDIGGPIPPDATEYVFMNPLPYAMRIELGWSSQAEEGVYELVSMEAREEFGDAFYIEYNLRSPITTHDFRGPDAGKYISVGHGTNKRRSRIISEHNESRVPSILIIPQRRTLH